MSKLLGLRSGFDDLVDIFQPDYTAKLKQQALIFDHLWIRGIAAYVIQLQNYSFTDDKKERVSEVIKDFEWLGDNGIVFDSPLSAESMKDLFEFHGQDLESTYYDAEKAAEKFHLKIKKRKKNTKNIKSDLVSFFGAHLRQDEIILRMLTAAINQSEGFTAVTTLPESRYTQELSALSKREVIKVVINNLPLPDSSTPWEQIIDFRNDPENRKNLLALRRWISKISTEDLRPAEVQEEIEWLINEFQTHMRFHKVKANTDTLEVLIKAPLEIIENLVKLKWSKIPEPFFALKKRQLLLMEAEINAPGKELAYIIKSRDAFQSQE